MKVGFVGLGNMGSAIARNLIRAGHELAIYNRTRSRAEACASFGARIAETPAAAAADADALVTMLADDAAWKVSSSHREMPSRPFPPGLFIFP